MDAIQWIITVGGLGLAGAVLWYFFAPTAGEGASIGRAAPVAIGATQTVEVLVEGGYSPATIELAAGRPVQLNFVRREDADCSAELLIPDFHIRRELPAFQTTAITLPAPAAGTYPFTCGMGMLKGRLIVT
ncbi:MAG: cupredoxin domain-containing protein [Hymenobacteraceae bacterium]|nr:cupredoxin domain-containing protein [Hymenobacteraceae bacterium]